METKCCTGCHKEKQLDQFQVKRRWRKKSDGSIVRYAAKTVTRCHACVYLIDKPKRKDRPSASKKYHTKSVKRNRKNLIQYANIKLHPYLTL